MDNIALATSYNGEHTHADTFNTQPVCFGQECSVDV